jgi:hypothetical protein
MDKFRMDKFRIWAATIAALFYSCLAVSDFEWMNFGCGLPLFELFLLQVFVFGEMISNLEIKEGRRRNSRPMNGR